jgi:lipopolysaccharide export system protein LptC
MGQEIGSGRSAAAARALRRTVWAGTLSRIVLAAMALGVLALVWMWLGPKGTSGLGKILPLPPEMPGQAISYESEIKGTDGEKKPFQIQAIRGYQDAKDKDIIHLETFSGSFRQTSGADMQVVSKTGTYDQKSKILDLAGDVEVKENARFTARMEKAQFDVEKRSLISQSPVQVTLPNGDIAADSLVADNNGERMLFRGKVKARFNRSAPAQGGTP